MSTVIDRAVVNASPTSSVGKVLLAKAPQQDLLAALQSVCGVVNRNNTIPILANLLVRKNGETLEFTGSDLELQIRKSSSLGAGATEAGTTVGARKLVDILHSMPNGQMVGLTLDGGKLIVTGGKSRFSVQTLPVEDFPLAVEATDYGAPFEIGGPALLGLISQTAYAMGVRDIRHYLNGLLIEAENRVVRAVASDGNRLALAEAVLPAPSKGQHAILPRKAVLELQRLLKDFAGGVQVRLSPQQASFSFGGMVLITRLLAGQFPDYRRVVPTASSTVVTTDRALLLASLERARLMCSDKSGGVELLFSSSRLELNARNGDEDAHEDIGIDYEGGLLSIGFNVGFLIEALSNIASDTVTIGLRGDTGSCLITHPGEPSFRGIVMPMRL